jgi:hypothetical protein
MGDPEPTASGVPLLAANPEQGLFKELNKYRFEKMTLRRLTRIALLLTSHAP